jgi:ABC-type dipeptide/oligopeptide/nickel transport system permease component
MLLNPEARASMPSELLDGIRGVLSNSITLVFASGVIFLVIGLVSGVFMGRERLKKTEAGKTGEVLKAEPEMI